MKKPTHFLKRTIAVCLTVLMLVSAAPLGELSGVLSNLWASMKAIAASSSEVIASGECGADGDNLTWILTNDGVLNINGTGAMEDCSSTSDWYENRSIITSVEINEGVTTIGDFAFYGCEALTRVVLPDSLTSIGECAFEYCNSIESIDIPNNVTIIEKGAFKDCTSLSSFVFPNQLVSVSHNCFANCKALRFVSIPLSVKSIESDAFRECNSLTDIRFPDYLEDIGEYAFYSCSQLTTLTIPESVKTIGNNAFFNCVNLEEVVVLGNNVSIGNAFENCRKLFTNEILADSKSVKACSFYKNEDISCIVIPQGITTIESCAFFECKNLKSVYIPNSVKQISNSAFYGCSNLSEIVMEDGIETIGNAAFYNCKKMNSFEIPASVFNIGDRAFSRCSRLTKMSFPASVTSIGLGIFEYADHLYEVSFCEGMTKIPDNALNGSTSINVVKIPNSVKRIGVNAFANSTITDVYYFGSEEDWNEIIIENGNDILYEDLIHFNWNENNTFNLEEGTCGDNVTYSLSSDGILIVSGFGSISFAPWMSRAKLISKVVFNGDITSLCASAFQNCINLRDFVLPENIDRIESRLFYDCSSLQSISIPDSVTSIGDSAFEKCSHLESITIPESVTSLGKYLFRYCESLIHANWPMNSSKITLGAFSDCISLNDFLIPNNVSIISNYAFMNCKSLSEIVLPESLEQIYSLAFAGCSSLENMNIPYSVTSIGAMAFSYCDSLRSLSIDDAAVSIGESAFFECPNLSSVSLGNSVAYISVGAFGRTAFVCDENNYDEDGVLYLDNVLLTIGDYNQESFTVKYGTTLIARDAMLTENAEQIKSIIIPDTVKIINDYGIGYYYTHGKVSETIIPDVKVYYHKSTVTKEFWPEAIQIGCDWIRINYSVPTCSEQGEEYSACSLCGDERVEPIPIDPNNHANYGTHLENAAEPFCLVAGYTGDTVCNGCGATLEEGEAIDALAHDWDDWVDNGEDHLRSCNRCGAEETAEHVWDDGVVTKEATCKEQGSKLFTCTVCDATKTEPIAIDSNNHADYGTHLENAVEPFCLVAGYTGDTVCNGCGATLEEGEAIDALVHDWDDWVDNGDDHIRTCNRCGAEETAEHVWDGGIVTKEATCKEQGSKIFTCTVCDATKTEPIAIDSNNHADYGTHLENAAEPFCLVAGYTGDTVCNGCGATLTEGEAIDALVHDWDDWVDNGDDHLRSCNRCSAEETAVHVWNDGVVTKEATCKEQGSKLFTCTVCDATKTEPIAINSNNHADYGTHLENAAEPFCLVAGYTGDTVCNGCGATLTEGEAIDALAHDWDEWVDNGDDHIRSCNRCGVEETAEHVWDDGVVTKEATCKEQGSKLFTCTVCDATKTEPIAIDSTNHADYGTHLENAAEPFCLVAGDTGDTVCNGCGATLEEGEAIQALAHDWDEWVDNGDDHIRSCNRCSAEETAVHVWNDGVVTKEATCKEQGSKLFTCTVCDATKTEPIAIDPTNHSDYGTHIENAATASCLVAGYTGDTVCNGCGATLEEGEAIDALAHDWDDWVDNGDDHLRSCNRCSAEETAVHVWNDGVVTKEATCKEQGSKLFTCTVCDATKTEPIAINSNNHANYGTHLENAAEPFCLVAGYTGDTVCNGCGATLTVGEAIDALGHDWGAWSASGENHIRTCQRAGCGAEETKAHVWSEWETVTEATYDENGLEKRVCSVCAAQETRPINKLQSWTVTFVVNDENGDFQYEGTTYSVVGKPVRFTSVDDVINPPAVPTLEGFVGKWQEFTLTENDLVVPAVYTKKADEEESELVTQKTSSYENGIVEITLDAFAKTNNVKTELGAKPYDIVLVVDQSGSMAYVMNEDREPNARYGETAADTRNAKLKSVANSFVNMVAETGLDHRIAIVGFGMASKAASGLSAYQNTAVLTPSKTQFGLNQNMQSAYENAFVSVKTNKATLTNAINGIQAKGATAADLGFEMAKGILANTDSTGRKRLVVFLTDGEPTYSSTFENDVANRTVNYSYLLKNVYGATVYSIAISDKANPNDETQNFNKFLHQTSSNYPFAKFGESGAAAAQKAYYYATTDATELENIFKDVFASTVSNTISFDKVTLYDTISKYFTLTVSQEEALRADLKARYGASAEDVVITRNADGTTSLSICVAPKAAFENNTQTGYGATVTFRVSANQDTVEAGYYDTNTSAAGVLDADGNQVASFEVPRIYIPQNRVFVTFKAGDEIYEIRDVRADEEIIAPQSSLGVWNIEPGTTVTENGTVFEAILNNNERIIKWNTGSESIVQSYKIGQLVYAPDVQAPEGMSFAGWDNAVPNRMPTMNLEFTATFTPHSHDWKKVGTTGDCESGMTTSYRCICGKTKQESTAPASHTYTAIITRELDESVVTMTCTVCGAYTTKHINYQTQYDKENKDRWGRTIGSTTTTVDLTLYDAQNITIQPDADEPITVYVPITAEQKAARNNLKVFRVQEDGQKVQVSAEVVGDYIVLHLDHFSYYVITETETAVPTYGQAVCSIKGHTYAEAVTPPTCKEKGYTTFACASCGDTYTDNETAVDSTNHASYGSHVENAKAATCKTDGYTGDTICNGCGATLQSGAVISKATVKHSLNHVDAKAATTEAEGNVEYYHCTVCGKNFSDANGTTELSKVTTDKLQKPDEPTTEKPKDDKPQKDYSACKYCGEQHTGAFGWLIKIIHSILALFGMRK